MSIITWLEPWFLNVALSHHITERILKLPRWKQRSKTSVAIWKPNQNPALSARGRCAFKCVAAHGRWVQYYSDRFCWNRGQASLSWTVTLEPKFSTFTPLILEGWGSLLLKRLLPISLCSVNISMFCLLFFFLFFLFYFILFCIFLLSGDFEFCYQLTLVGKVKETKVKIHKWRSINLLFD